MPISDALKNKGPVAQNKIARSLQKEFEDYLAAQGANDVSNLSWGPNLLHGILGGVDAAKNMTWEDVKNIPSAMYQGFSDDVRDAGDVRGLYDDQILAEKNIPAGLALAGGATGSGFGASRLSPVDSTVGMAKMGHASPRAIAGDLNLKNIGAGTGEKQYGEGFYNASENPVAERYFRDFGGYEYGQDHFTFNGLPLREVLDSDLESYGKDAGKVRRILDSIKDKNTRNFNELNKTLTANEREFFNSNIQPHMALNQQNPSLYEMDVPDSALPSYANWHDKIKDTPAIQKNKFKEMLGDTYVNAEDLSVGDFYKALSQQLGGDKKASEAFAQYGLSGVKYRDPGSFGRTDIEGIGGFNYVTMNQNVLDDFKILSRNSLPLGVQDTVPHLATGRIPTDAKLDAKKAKEKADTDALFAALFADDEFGLLD